MFLLTWPNLSHIWMRGGGVTWFDPVWLLDVYGTSDCFPMSECFVDVHRIANLPHFVEEIVALCLSLPAFILKGKPKIVFLCVCVLVSKETQLLLRARLKTPSKILAATCVQHYRNSHITPSILFSRHVNGTIRPLIPFNPSDRQTSCRKVAFSHWNYVAGGKVLIDDNHSVCRHLSLWDLSLASTHKGVSAALAGVIAVAP